MKIGGCVVLYNPGVETLGNVETYRSFLSELIVVDNSPSPNAVSNEIAALDKVRYFNMGGNAGIATALNIGCRSLQESGCDIALTMDQDSRFPLNDASEIIEKVVCLLSDYALVGLNFNVEEANTEREITEVKYWLTSGNFLSLAAYDAVGGFNDDLFIDYVDIEFGHRLKEAGLKLCYLNQYSLTHEIGSPIAIKIFGRTYYAMNHSPVRYYYRYRNSSYLYKGDKKFYREKYFKELLINIPKMILFESNRMSKIKMIRRGLSDGLHGVLGPYREVRDE